MTFACQEQVSPASTFYVQVNAFGFDKAAGPAPGLVVSVVVLQLDF